MDGVTLNVVGFDHLVLRCADVEASLAWYLDELGLPEVRVAEWRNGQAPFPSVRISREAIIDLIPRRGEVGERNLDHLCLVVADICRSRPIASASSTARPRGTAPRVTVRASTSSTRTTT